MTITFKETVQLNDAILAVACNEGHGNKTKVIARILRENSAVTRELKIIEKKSKKNLVLR